MVQVRIGGDPESYMGAPSLGGGGGSDSGGSFIAGLLDLLGIHRQVAKGDKKDSKKPGVTAPIMAEDAPIQTQVPVLDLIGQAVGSPAPDAQPTTPLGQKWLDSMQPIMTFDPGASTASKRK